jgi:hypothetical protein
MILNLNSNWTTIFNSFILNCCLIIIDFERVIIYINIKSLETASIYLKHFS